MTLYKRKNDQNLSTEWIVPAAIMVGVGLIYVLQLSFWPWILCAIGTGTLAKGMLNPEKLGEKLQGAVWIYGIFVMALTNFWWPGMLFLVAISVVMKALLGPQFEAIAGRRKPKRGLPFPPEDDEDLY